MCVAKSDGNEVFISMQPNTLENFIPVHPNEFQAAIEHSDFINVQAWEKVRELKGSLSEILHRRARRDYGPLFEAYVPFDPDRDGLVSKFVATRTTAEVFEQTELLLEHANYRRLRPSEIYEAVRTTSAWGGKLRIRMSDYKRLRVYARGDTQTQRTKRLGIVGLENARSACRSTSSLWSYSNVAVQQSQRRRRREKPRSGIRGKRGGQPNLCIVGCSKIFRIRMLTCCCQVRFASRG